MVSNEAAIVLAAHKLACKLNTCVTVYRCHTRRPKFGYVVTSAFNETLGTHVRFVHPTLVIELVRGGKHVEVLMYILENPPASFTSHFLASGWSKVTGNSTKDVYVSHSNVLARQAADMCGVMIMQKVLK